MTENRRLLAAGHRGGAVEGRSERGRGATEEPGRGKTTVVALHADGVLGEQLRQMHVRAGCQRVEVVCVGSERRNVRRNVGSLDVRDECKHCARRVHDERCRLELGLRIR